MKKLNDIVSVGDTTTSRLLLFRRWISALRSGAYTQAKGALFCEGKGYCCLGVLCSSLEVPSHVDQLLSPELRSFVYEKSTGVGCLPGDLRTVLDISCSLQDHLIRLNDSNGATFQEIARFLEGYVYSRLEAEGGL